MWKEKNYCADMLLLKNKLLFALVLKEIENVGSPYAAVAVVVVGVIATVEEKKTNWVYTIESYPFFPLICSTSY